MRYLFLLFLQLSLFAVDFDCIMVGSSPFSLFEALYLSHSGNKVLILEEAAECGGAWKAITVCGIPHVDLGCHQIGHDMQLKAFLEEYAGCQIVSIDHPLASFETQNSPTGYYFSRGCFELIDNLLKLIEKTDIVLQTNAPAQTVSINKEEKTVCVHTPNQSYTAKKLIVTPASSLHFQTHLPQNHGKTKYYHLYLLIQDPTPPRFSYHNGLANGVSRLMNLTYFAGIANTGRQLIAIQTHGEQALNNGILFLDLMKTKNLIGEGAYILQEDRYIYEAGIFQQGIIVQLGIEEFVEVLKTGHIQQLSASIPKWKEALKPYENPGE